MGRGDVMVFGYAFKWPVIKLPKPVSRTTIGQLTEIALRYAPTLQGRASRLELVVTFLIVSVAWLTLISIAPDLRPAKGDELSPTGWAIAVFQLLPLLSVVIRRLHDTGRRWWALIVIIAPYIGWVILLVILLWKGDPNENDFGPPTNTV